VGANPTMSGSGLGDGTSSEPRRWRHFPVKSPYTHKSGAEIPSWDRKNAGTADRQCKIVPENERDRSKPLKKPPSRGGCTAADYIMLS